MQVVGFVLFACLLVFWRLFFELKIHAHAHKKGALFFTYTSFKATLSGGTKTFQKQKPCVSDDAVPAEHAGNDDDDDDGLFERRWRRETTPGATTLCFVFFRVPTFFFCVFRSIEREREKVCIDR